MKAGIPDVVNVPLKGQKEHEPYPRCGRRMRFGPLIRVSVNRYPLKKEGVP